MKTYLYLDTETSCLAEKHIVQLAAILATETEEIASMNVLIKPEGWTIDPGAEAIHGISMERAQKYGVGIETALWLFDSLAENADVLTAHNLFFDYSVVRAEYARLGREFVKEGYCTMLGAMKPMGVRRWPKLMAAHVWATGEGFDGAHDAMADVRACLRVHRVLLKGGLRCDICDCLITDGRRDPVTGEPLCSGCIPF